MVTLGENRLCWTPVFGKWSYMVIKPLILTINSSRKQLFYTLHVWDNSRLSTPLIHSKKTLDGFHLTTGLQRPCAKDLRTSRRSKIWCQSFEPRWWAMVSHGCNSVVWKADSAVASSNNRYQKPAELQSDAYAKLLSDVWLSLKFAF